MDFKYIPHSLYNGEVSYSMMSPGVVGGLHIKCLTDELEEKLLEETKDGQEKLFSISKELKKYHFIYFYFFFYFLYLYNLFLLWHTFYYCGLLKIFTPHCGVLHTPSEGLN